MANKVDIANQGLLLLGASQITNFNDGSPNANRVKLVYNDTRDSLLRAYPWKFATKLVQITEEATAPIFGRAHSYKLPGDYLKLLPPYPEDNWEMLDWIVEGNFISTDCSSPLDVRYTRRVEDPDCMDVSFRKALSALLAVELAEPITQSNSKLNNVAAIFERRIGEAKKASAFEKVNHLPPMDSWISVRQRGQDNTLTWHW